MEEDNFNYICNLTTDIMNMPKGSLSLKNRRRPLQAARSVAAYIGKTEEDIHNTVIAKILNRDRTLVYHYVKRHDSHYKSCSVYRNTFNKVYKAYKGMYSDKDMFTSGKFMKDFLIKKGVKEVIKSDVLIEVLSGEVKCIINSSYFKYTEHLEIIKLAMTKHHYTVNII